MPDDGTATSHASALCNHTLDRRIARAAALQAVDPAGSDAAWTALDRKLTDLAIWASTGVPNEVDLISRRVGNYQFNPVWGVLLDQLWVRR